VPNLYNDDRCLTGIMLTCAQALISEFREELEEAVASVEEKPEEVIYELNPSIGDVESSQVRLRKKRPCQDYGSQP